MGDLFGIPYNIWMTSCIIFSVYSLIMLVIYIVSFYKLFEKENYKKWYAFIPFLNFYIYFKMCDVPFILFFIPVLNVICLFLMPYKLAKRYGYSRLFRWISVLLPFIYIPLISFSEKDNIYHEHTNVFVKNNSDIDELEKQLVINSKIELMNLSEKEEKKLIEQEKKKEDVIDKIEASIDNSFDEIIYNEPNSDDNIVSQTETLLEDDTHDIEELEFVDEDADKNIDISEIEKLDNQTNINKEEKQIEQNFKEIEKEVKVETIAFGGKEQVSKYSTEAKEDDLKCPRCGSSLIGAKDFCPGCNLDLNTIKK